MPNKLYLITGATSGLGLTLTKKLSNEGLVLAVGRNNDILTSLSALKNIYSLKADLSDPEASDLIARTVLDIKQENPSTDLYVIHCAGCATPNSILDFNDTVAAKEMYINAIFPIQLTKHLWQEKLLTPDSRTIFISSGLSTQPMPGLSSYCASKAALSMYIKLLQAEIREGQFAELLPGIFESPMQERLRENPSFLSSTVFKQLHSDKRLQPTQQVADFVTNVLSIDDNMKFTETRWDIQNPSHVKEASARNKNGALLALSL